MGFLANLRKKLESIRFPNDCVSGQDFALPAGLWLCAIGDVHGEFTKLDNLLAEVAKAKARAEARGLNAVILFLGDLIDRGPESRAVLQRAITDPLLSNARFLRGNHEQSMLGFLNDPLRHRAWLNHGGRDTMSSFGVLVGEAVPDDMLMEIRDELAGRLSSGLRHFLMQLEPCAVYGGYLFVHAGLRPGLPLERQNQDDLLWIREPFISSRRNHGYRVVHGHTISLKPEVLPNRIGIDTGAYAGGPLTAVVIEQDGINFLTD